MTSAVAEIFYLFIFWLQSGFLQRLSVKSIKFVLTTGAERGPGRAHYSCQTEQHLWRRFQCRCQQR